MRGALTPCFTFAGTAPLAARVAAAAAAAVAAEDDDPECLVCFDPTAATLRCGHPVCEVCAEKLARAQAEDRRQTRRVVVRCPMRCHAPTPLPASVLRVEA